MEVTPTVIKGKDGRYTPAIKVNGTCYPIDLAYASQEVATRVANRRQGTIEMAVLKNLK